MISPRKKRIRSGASGASQRIPLGVRLKVYVLQHLQVLFYSLGQLSRTPVSTLMTSAVIGIALSLPTAFYVLLQNVQTVSQDWDRGARISLFLKASVTEAQAQAMVRKLRTMKDISEVVYISRTAALAEFRRSSGFGDAIDALGDNPLPAVLVVQPAKQLQSAAEIEALLARLRTYPEVDITQLDLEWVKRLYALVQIGQRGVIALALLLALSVLLVVGNTIRLAIQNRRDEIVVTKLIGGTDSFIRRPFLYTGIWYGLVGGVLGWLAVSFTLGLLAAPVNDLASLYNSDFTLSGVDLITTGMLLLVSPLLGLLGSWLAVGRHLGDIEPT